MKSFLELCHSNEDYGTFSEEAKEALKADDGSGVNIEDKNAVEWYYAKEEAMKKVSEAAHTLTDAVNRYKEEDVAEAFFKGFVVNHRTLQGSAMKSLFKFFQLYQNAGYDPRNKSAVMAARRITSLAEEENVSFPLV